MVGLDKRLFSTSRIMFSDALANAPNDHNNLPSLNAKSNDTQEISNSPFKDKNKEFEEYLELWKKYKEKGEIEIKNYSRKKKSDLYFINFNENFFLDHNIIQLAINDFWNDVMDNIKDNQYVIILFKVHYTERVDGVAYDHYATFDKINKIIKDDKDDYIDTLWNILDIKDQRYLENEVHRIIIEYWIKDNNTGKPVHLLSTLKNIKNFKNPEKILNNQTSKISNLNIPLNRNYETWGNVVSNRNNKFLEIQDFNDKDKYYHVDIFQKYTKVEIKINTNKIIYTFEDHGHLSFIKEYPKMKKNLFVRVINNSEFVIDDNKSEIVLKSIKTKTDFLQTINKDRKIINKFITLDIETRVDNNNDIGKHVPYCICYFDGLKQYSFYVTDYEDHNHMLKEAILSLLKPKYSGHVIYVHNLSNFDGIFMLNTFASIISDNIKIYPTLREDKFINIKINYGPNSKYNISFRDSLLLLPLSLSKLTKGFDVKHLKTSFPHKFLNNKYNEDLDLNYIGKIPSITYFDDTSNYINFVEDYFNSKFNNKKYLSSWNLRDEALKYCTNDCVALYEVLIKFNDFIFTKFKLNIHNYPTIPSLTFAIFRSNYLRNIFNKGYYIPLIDGKLYDNLKESYTGGSVDMFIPSNKNITTGERIKINGYDVNSLYPKSMDENMFMPVLSKKLKYITYFEGDISLLRDNSFGFFNVNVETTKELEHPILQLHYNSNVKGNRNITNTISPLGSWNYTYFSQELYNSEEYGYNYKINNGYIFDQFNIFGDFISEMYKIKEDTKGDKNNPWYIISKLLMNSLYGRFGMSPIFENHSIIDLKDLESYIDKYDVISYKELDNSNGDLDNNKILISYKDLAERTNKLDNNPLDSNNKNNKNVSIVIASAITAYARIFMSHFKNNPNYRLYYSDTDSIFIDGELDPALIGNKLGQFKLEYVLDKFVALAPKVYGGVTEDGKEFTKIKGFKNKVSFDELEELLNKNKILKLNQTKWFKDLNSSNIFIKNQIYNLTVTSNKRELVYENDILVNTTPKKI